MTGEVFDVRSLPTAACGLMFTSASTRECRRWARQSIATIEM